MEGRIYAINPQERIVAIETELHGFTIVELQGPFDVKVGDEVQWDSDLELGLQPFVNLGTRKSMDVLIRSHMVSRSSVRLFMGMLP